MTPSATRIAVIRKLWRKIGSDHICFQLPVPIQCGLPIAFQLVNDSQTTTPSGTIANSAKNVIAGIDQRKLGRPTVRPPELFLVVVIRRRSSNVTVAMVFSGSYAFSPRP